MFLVFSVHFQPANAFFVLFEVILSLIFCNLVSKSVFVTKSACPNLALKFSVVSLLNSGVVIYLP